MNRQMYQWISELIRNKPNQDSKRGINPLSQQVMMRYGCGYVCKSSVIFSAEDKRRLRQRVMEELDIDPFMTEQLPNDRLEMAKYHANEKLAAKPVGGDHLLLNSTDGLLRINGVKIPLHPERVVSAGMLCLNSSIQTVEHQTIVVIENLAIMPLCHAWQIPAVGQQALWVYRGDNKSGAKASACRDFIERFGGDKTIIVFSDMDPKGLEIALTFPFAKFWLGPNAASWRPLLNSRYASPVGFDIQSEAIDYLLRQLDSNSLSEPFKNLISVMRDQRSSFRQEHTYSHDVLLELIPIRTRV